MQQEPHRRQMFQSAPPPPEGLHAGFPIAVASQKASQLGNPAGRFPQGGRRERNRCAPVDLGVEGLPFIRLQHDFTRHLQPLARLIGQPEQSPRYRRSPTPAPASLRSPLEALRVSLNFGDC